MNPLYPSLLRAIVARVPAVVPYLRGRARWIAFVYEAQFFTGWYAGNQHYDTQYKTYEYYLANIERLIRSVYSNQIGGDFIDIMANLISGQLTQAFQQAWMDEEGDGAMPDYLREAAEEMILSEYDHVDSFFREIVDARLDEAPVDPLLSRAAVWANRWNDAYNQAVALITAENGGNLMWERGATEQSCRICSALDGIVARASEWEALNVKPQNPPNPILDKENGGCGGWLCDCSLTPTDKRRSPKAFDTIMNIVQKG